VVGNLTNRYVLGAKPRIKVLPVDENGSIFVPSEIRLSIKEPTGDITTFSGAELFTASGGWLYTLYTPLTKGWYQYETWVKDGNGLEDTATNGFEVYGEVYYDI